MEDTLAWSSSVSSPPSSPVEDHDRADLTALGEGFLLHGECLDGLVVPGQELRLVLRGLQGGGCHRDDHGGHDPGGDDPPAGADDESSREQRTWSERYRVPRPTMRPTMRPTSAGGAGPVERKGVLDSDAAEAVEVAGGIGAAAHEQLEHTSHATKVPALTGVRALVLGGGEDYLNDESSSWVGLVGKGATGPRTALGRWGGPPGGSTWPHWSGRARAWFPRTGHAAFAGTPVVLGSVLATAGVSLRRLRRTRRPATKPPCGSSVPPRR